jgi:hypothetical protein
MIQGFNSDIKFKGVIYHVQTQDKGINNPKIETLVYKKGVILNSRLISYEDILSSDCLEEVVTEVMTRQHNEAIKEVQEGKFFDEDDTDVSILRRRVREAFEHMILKYKNQ